MDDKKICSCCEKQSTVQTAHADLKLISSIPESSIYRCSCCNTFWMYDIDGWEHLEFDTVLGMAS